jgi:Zn-dependent protease with chaperone function
LTEVPPITAGARVHRLACRRERDNQGSRDACLMIFSNLLYLIVVIIALGTRNVPELPELSPGYFLPVFLLKGLFFLVLIRYYQARKKFAGSNDYFQAEKSLAGLAVLFFLLDVYLLGIHYYLGLVPLREELPSLVNLAGLAWFYLYMLLVWAALKKRYEEVFGGRRRLGGFLLEQLRNSSALVVPWLLLIFFYDFLLLIPSAKWQELLATVWGEIAVFSVFLVALVLWFPNLLVKAMGCRPLPAGEDREIAERFSRRLGIEFKEICLWPFFEGKVLTAGVMGLTKHSRYLLLTPALLAALNPVELEAVLAHEVGHLKKYHLLLYLLLFLGFGILLQLGLQPLIYGLLNSQFFYELLFGLESNPETMLTILTGLPMVVLALLYFRFIFGFFMRNFERQADLYAYRVIGRVEPLVTVLEKIAWLSGHGRDQPNWHHFGLGQRIDYLEACQAGEKNPAWHEFKVYSCLGAYLIFLIVAAPLAWRFGDILSATARPGAKFAENFIERQLAKEPDNPFWLHLQGDLLVDQKRYAEAAAAYESSLALRDDNPEVLNNLAWLLLTAEQGRWRDPKRALVLAERAATLSERSHILDTLAEAYWQNGQAEKAVATERRALEIATNNREYYREQISKFSGSSQNSGDE